jgi:Na+/H+ antiporter NhaC
MEEGATSAAQGNLPGFLSRCSRPSIRAATAVLAAAAILVLPWAVVAASSPIPESAALGAGSSGPLFGHAHWTSVLPPLLAIMMALIFHQVILSLFFGIWLGAFLLTPGGVAAPLTSFFAALTDSIVPAASDPDHMSIIIFSMLIGGMVGIISENGGTRGVIRLLTQVVKTRVRGQLASFGVGVAIFFDDYTTIMVVGNTMRPLTDRLGITRAKLAYLVDTAAAPVAVLALVSTWVGALVAFISDSTASMAGFDVPPYAVFLGSLPYNFYSVFTIFFAFLIAWTGRDFGPMLRARLGVDGCRANAGPVRSDPKPEPLDATLGEARVSHWANAAVPMLVLVVATVAGLLLTGEGETIADIVASADSYLALLWGSLLSVAVAMVMTLSQRLLGTEAMVEALMRGMYVVFGGLIILVLAWALSALTRELGTAEFLVGVFGHRLDPSWMPAILFVLSGLTAFATGSSWGTIGILMPLSLPLIWSMGADLGQVTDGMHELVFISVGAVLAGSALGDHASPISDTTILTSLATQCDHVEHVNTQLPYALVAAGVALAGLLLIPMTGAPWWVIHLLGFSALSAIVLGFGRNSPADPAQPAVEPVPAPSRGKSSG